MQLINREFIRSLGIVMTDEHLDVLSEHFETTLNERVTNEIVAELDDEQLKQLTKMRDAPEERLQQWLSQSVPSLKEIIEDETAILLGEIAENSDNL